MEEDTSSCDGVQLKSQKQNDIGEEKIDMDYNDTKSSNKRGHRFTKNETASHVGIRRSFSKYQISSKAKDILRQWFLYCNGRNCDPFCASIDEVIEFLTLLFNQGLRYSAINTARSALSTIVFVNNQPVGTNPLVVRFLKGVFNLRPSLPRSKSTWDITLVLNYLKTLHPLTDISLKLLTYKFLALLAILSGQRVQSFFTLELKDLSVCDSSLKFSFSSLLKQSRPGFHQNDIELKSFSDSSLSIVEVYKQYIERTASLRGNCEKLLISFVRPYGPVSKDTIARGLRKVLQMAGIDASIFSAHSYRASSYSAASRFNVPIQTILETGGWSRESTFQKFYNKKLIKSRSMFSDTILNSV